MGVISRRECCGSCGQLGGVGCGSPAGEVEEAGERVAEGGGRKDRESEAATDDGHDFRAAMWRW